MMMKGHVFDDRYEGRPMAKKKLFHVEHLLQKIFKFFEIEDESRGFKTIWVLFMCAGIVMLCASSYGLYCLRHMVAGGA